MSEKIAIIVDSGSDVSEQLRQGLDIVSLPLRISVDGKDFIDGVDITAAEVFAALETSKVTSSLPTGEDILNAFERLKAEGYTHAIAITISSGLSGTYNVVRNFAQEVDGLTVSVIDTRNISLGSGFLAIRAAENVKKGMSYDAILADIDTYFNRSKVFFTVGTLDYLIRGGRIGMVAGTVANVLNIKPVISCNPEGIYHTVAKVRGYNRVIHKMLETAREFAGDSESYRVILLNANSQQDLDAILKTTKEMFPFAQDVQFSAITPALAIHTGPEAMGIAVIKN